MPSEDSIRDVCNELCLSMDTINPPDGNQQPMSLSYVQNLEANMVASYVKVHPSNNNAKQSTQSQLSSKNAQGKRFWPRKIDRRRSCEKWLFKIAKRPLYHLVPQNSEIHNFTTVKLTERQSRVLGFTTFTTTPK